MRFKILVFILFNLSYISAQEVDSVAVRLFNDFLDRPRLIDRNGEFISESKVLFSIDDSSEIYQLEDDLSKLIQFSDFKGNIECFTPNLCLIFYKDGIKIKSIELCLTCKKAFIINFDKQTKGMYYFHNTSVLERFVEIYGLDIYIRN